MRLSETQILKGALVAIALVGIYNLYFSQQGIDLNQSMSVEKDNSIISPSSQLPPVIASALNSATGTIFLGEKIRSFDQDNRFFNDWDQKLQQNSRKDETDDQSPRSSIHTRSQDVKSFQRTKKVVVLDNTAEEECTKWNVVTTIFEPTESVKRAAFVPGWCTVIVADTKTPTDYMALAGFNGHEKIIHFLSVQAQEELIASKGPLSEFVKEIPYRHFARKNIGYLYAIQHGATFVFDFDDDNLLDQNYDPLPNSTHLVDARMVLIGPNVLNHHALMGAANSNSWPRGFPLEFIQNTSTKGSIAYENVTLDMKKVAVMQFCADSNPDVDAIHRLVHPLPLNFDRSAGSLIVPHHAFVPYNAQATLHTYQSLWALFLPFTVPGRVSDIWRGYFAQALFRDLDMSLVLLPPRVIQNRNAHNYLADMSAEKDLYFKSGALIDFLSHWISSSRSIPERMEQLWVDLYERGYIEINDVHVSQLWLKALVAIKYKFPSIKRNRRDKTVVMGQFNYPNNVNDVIFWVQKWREGFNRVQVRGPFSSTAISDLQSHGIQVFKGKNDQGLVSPMENFMHTLQQYQFYKNVTGVLYIHDDALLNLTDVFSVNSFNSQNVIISHPWVNPRQTDNKEKLAKTSTFRMQPNTSHFSKIDGTQYDTAKALLKSLPEWYWTSECIEQFSKVLQDPKSKTYLEKDGMFLFPRKGQSDFYYLPTSLTQEFSQAVNLFVKSKVFLECGFPKISDILTSKYNATLRSISLCTDWQHSRGTYGMIEKCEKSTRTFGMYHPYKMHLVGLKKWSQTFDEIALSN